jgi:hypothetical protein
VQLLKPRANQSAIGDSRVSRPNGEAIASQVTSLGGIPLAVITAGRQDNFPRTPAWLYRALTRLWDGMQDGSPRTGQPSIIIRAAHARLPQCRRLFSGSDVRCRG